LQVSYVIILLKTEEKKNNDDPSIDDGEELIIKVLWMIADTWAALVFHYFEFPSSLNHDGKQLRKAITLD
jgi:hypothetical protein